MKCLILFCLSFIITHEDERMASGYISICPDTIYIKQKEQIARLKIVHKEGQKYYVRYGSFYGYINLTHDDDRHYAAIYLFSRGNTFRKRYRLIS